jgi:signal transduction histidine kinase
MRLADFIFLRMDVILRQWDSFARTRLPAATAMSELALRDHAREMLEAIARDLGTPQTSEEQERKSQGLAPVLMDARETAAQTYAILRARSGFDINQLASEYRALRASVLQLWIDDCLPDVPHMQDMIRFNEAIDQALAESISFFHTQVEHSRDLFLGVLGHDMRNPLQAIQVTAAYLAALHAGEKISEAASRLMHSGQRLKTLLDDLVDFNRTNLGLGIRINRVPADLKNAFSEEIDLLRVANGDRTVELEVQGDCQGSWDVSRLRQMLGNIVQNAVQYGAAGEPVVVRVTEEPTHVRIEVTNKGPAIDADELLQLFTPLRRGRNGDANAPANGSMGLGLFIVREIARAHGGDATVASENNETVVTVTLSRHLAAVG